jgi:hypothetical protein
MAERSALSSVQLTAAATEVLVGGGYSQVPTPSSWPATARLFEDPYGIVALHVYDGWPQLRDNWNVAQGLLVDIISEHLHRPEPKAWEGYLVLLTGSPILDVNRRDIVDLRYNTNRVRKLVATGYELETLSDVRSVLLPLLPLDVKPPSISRAGLLDRLPALLQKEGIGERVTELAISAFLGNESIMERLHHMDGVE